jgi:hypothetical protein
MPTETPHPGDPERDQSINVAAVVFAQSKSTFSAGEFAQFLQMGGMPICDEHADEILSDLVDRQQLRQIGPGVYAAKVDA